MEIISLKTLLEAGCHFGHKSERWHPKAAQFIFQERDGIHIIDLAKTKTGLEKAGHFLKQLAKDGKTALFVGTKRQALTIIKEECESSDIPHIRQSWIGGFLTNWDQVHKNLEKIRKLTDDEKNNAWKIYPKHERVKLSRYLRKLLNLYGGVVKLMEKPDALVVVDVKREDVAVREALRSGIPVVGIVDTNSDPSQINYVVPANDDAVGSIKMLVHYLAQAYKEGVDERVKESKTDKAEKTEKVIEKTTEVKEVPKVSQEKEVKKTSKAPEVLKVPENKISEKMETGEKPKKKRGRPKKIKVQS